MTTLDEKVRALKLSKELLENLCDPGKTPRVPSMIRNHARGILRHYPLDYELTRLAEISYADANLLDIYTISDKIQNNTERK